MTKRSLGVGYVYGYLNLEEVQKAAIRSGIFARTEWHGLQWIRLVFSSYDDESRFMLRWWDDPSVQVLNGGQLPTGEFAFLIAGWIPLKLFEWLEDHTENKHYWCGPTAVIFASEDDRALFEAVL